MTDDRVTPGSTIPEADRDVMTEALVRTWLLDAGHDLEVDDEDDTAAQIRPLCRTFVDVICETGLVVSAETWRITNALYRSAEGDVSRIIGIAAHAATKPTTLTYVLAQIAEAITREPDGERTVNPDGY